MQRKKLKIGSKKNDDGLDLLTPGRYKIATALEDSERDRYNSIALPQDSPGQPRKGHNGNNTIENFTRSRQTSNSKNHSGNNSITTINNNSEDEDEDLMQTDESKYLKISISKSGNRPSTSQSAESDDVILRQLLPKNRRAVSGRRIGSSACGVRKLSGTTKRTNI